MKRFSIESLEFKNLSFEYDAENQVFSGLNFIFQRDEVFYLQGSTGGGKNTFIKLLLGLVPPGGGEYLINGRTVNDFSHSEFDPYRLNMGSSFDVGGLVNNQSLYENLKLPLDYHHFMQEERKRDYIIEKLSLFHLQDQKHLRPAHVSSGARKAVALLRAFLMDPEVVVLNNPTLGLNSDLIDPLIKLIQDHLKNKNLGRVLIASEDKELIQQLPGKVLRIEAGKIFSEEENNQKKAS